MVIASGIDSKSLHDQYPTVKTRYRAERRPLERLHSSMDDRRRRYGTGAPQASTMAYQSHSE